MPDAIAEPGPAPELEGSAPGDQEWGPPYASDEGLSAIPEPAFDRYAIPEPDEIVPTYVRNETPWEGISGEPASPDFAPLAEVRAATGDEPEFTRLLRRRQRWRDTVAWITTGALIVTTAWFLPVLLVPTSSLGRVGAFATLSVGGLTAVVVLVKTWRWAHRAP
jgi:hypothetical protein